MLKECIQINVVLRPFVKFTVKCAGESRTKHMGLILELMRSSLIVSKYLSIACVAVHSVTISWMHGFSRFIHLAYLAGNSFQLMSALGKHALKCQ
jgi:malate/lactate dehydrogenase